MAIFVFCLTYQLNNYLCWISYSHFGLIQLFYFETLSWCNLQLIRTWCNLQLIRWSNLINVHQLACGHKKTEIHALISHNIKPLAHYCQNSFLCIVAWTPQRVLPVASHIVSHHNYILPQNENDLLSFTHSLIVDDKVVNKWSFYFGCTFPL